MGVWRRREVSGCMEEEIGKWVYGGGERMKEEIGKWVYGGEERMEEERGQWVYKGGERSVGV